MLDRIKRWWSGSPDLSRIQDFERSGFVILGPAPRTFHWTAKLARSVVRFVARDWKWVVGTMIAIVAIIVTVFE